MRASEAGTGRTAGGALAVAGSVIAAPACNRLWNRDCMLSCSSSMARHTRPACQKQAMSCTTVAARCEGVPGQSEPRVCRTMCMWGKGRTHGLAHPAGLLQPHRAQVFSHHLHGHEPPIARVQVACPAAQPPSAACLPVFSTAGECIPHDGGKSPAPQFAQQLKPAAQQARRRRVQVRQPSRRASQQVILSTCTSAAIRMQVRSSPRSTHWQWRGSHFVRRNHGAMGCVIGPQC